MAVAQMTARTRRQHVEFFDDWFIVLYPLEKNRRI